MLMNSKFEHWSQVFQRRFNGSVNFTRNWTEYQDGFGELTGEFWLGNEKLRLLTAEKQWFLQIELTLCCQANTTKRTWNGWSFRIEGDNYTAIVPGSTGRTTICCCFHLCRFSQQNILILK